MPADSAPGENWGSDGLQLQPLQPGDFRFGAVVDGVDVEQLDAAAWAAIEAALLDHGLLVIRNQAHLSTEGLVDFARHWETEPVAAAAVAAAAAGGGAAGAARKKWLDSASATSGAELTGQKERTKATAQATAQYRVNRHGQPDPSGEIRCRLPAPLQRLLVRPSAGGSLGCRPHCIIGSFAQFSWLLPWRQLSVSSSLGHLPLHSATMLQP